MKLVASAPLLLVAILIVLFSMWLGSFVARRMRLLSRLARSNPYRDGLLRGGAAGRGWWLLLRRPCRGLSHHYRACVLLTGTGIRCRTHTRLARVHS